MLNQPTAAEPGFGVMKVEYDLFVQATPDMVRDVLDGSDVKIKNSLHIFAGWHRIIIEVKDREQLREVAEALQANGIRLARSANY